MAWANTIKPNQIIGCDHPSRGLVNALHQGFARDDDAISSAADSGGGRADGLCKRAHRDALGDKGIVEFHGLHYYVYRKLFATPVVSSGKRLHDRCKKCKAGNELENETNTLAIHKALKEAREHAGLSLEKAAERIGVSGASFSRMENGLSKVTMDRLEVLSALYEVSASALVEGSVVTKPSTIDIERLKLVVQTVQQVVNERAAQPSPEKMALAVSEIYQLEITHIVNDADAKFDPSRRLGIIEAIIGD